MEEEVSVPFPYKSKTRVVVTLSALACIVALSHFGPRILKTPFGAARQVQVSTETLTYTDTTFSFDYPSAWTARDVSADPVVQNFLPGISHVAAVGPGHDIEHAIIISSYPAADLERAVIEREQKNGNSLIERTPITLNAGATIRLTFVSKSDANERRTYYLFQAAPTAAIVLHGPGDKMRDTAGEIITKTFTFNKGPQ